MWAGQQSDKPDAGNRAAARGEILSILTRLGAVRCQAVASQSLVKVATMNGLGLVKQSEVSSDPEGVTYIDTTYDGQGHPYQVSNSYRTTSDPTYGLTTYAYDALARIIREM